MPSDFQVIEYAFCSLAAFPDGRHDKIRAAHHITTGEHLGIACLERETLVLRRDDATPVVDPRAQ